MAWSASLGKQRLRLQTCKQLRIRMQEDQQLTASKIYPYTVAGYGVTGRGRQQDMSTDVHLLWQGVMWPRDRPA